MLLESKGQSASNISLVIPMATVTGFFRDNQNRVRPITEKTGKKAQKQFIVPSNKVSLPHPSFAKRPLFFMKGTTVQLGVLNKQNGDVESPVPIATFDKSKLTRSYDTDSRKQNKPGDLVHYNGSPDLTPSKLWQRRAMAEKLSGGTVVEVFAGRGHLSKEWAKKADKMVMVDKNAESLKEAEKAVKGTPHETIAANNLDWLENELPQEKIRNLKAVDFDAFGSPAKQIKKFFDNNPINKSMLIAVTDGSCMYVKLGEGSQTKEFCKENYGIQLDGSRVDQIRALDKLMLDQGRKHGFKVEPINAAYGRQTVYAGYKITPT